jgi:ABC-2 type transport system permease protein
MSAFMSVFHTEFNMSIRRRGLWLAYGILFIFYFMTLIVGRVDADSIPQTRQEMWNRSAQMAFLFNLLLPVVAGISAADRLVRDRTCKMEELLLSIPLKRNLHVLGKYLAAVASLSLPVLVVLMLVCLYSITRGFPANMLWMTFVSFFVINLPAFAFVSAFGLVCPLFLPLRVYQILFTGYWFWGNYLSPQVFPTLSGTLLQAGGKVAMEGWFGAAFGSAHPFTSLDVYLNFLVLAVCIIAVLEVGVIRLKKDGLTVH